MKAGLGLHTPHSPGPLLHHRSSQFGMLGTSKGRVHCKGPKRVFGPTAWNFFMTVARGLMTSLGLNGFTHPVGGEVVVHRL